MRQFSSEIPQFANLDINIDKLEDHTGITSFFRPNDTPIVWAEMKENMMSSWAQYPEKYKFFSFSFDLSLDSVTHIKQSYGIIHLAGDVGGIYIVAFRTFGLFTILFARLHL